MHSQHQKWHDNLNDECQGVVMKIVLNERKKHKKDVKIKNKKSEEIYCL